MKLFFVLGLITSLNVFAVPVLNSNVSISGKTITIWPDHKNPNQFYFAPNRMELALDKDGKPQLSVIDYKVGACRWGRRCERKLLLTTYFEAAYRDSDLEDTKAKIMATNPKANFSPVPFISSQVQFGTTLYPFIDEHNCSPMGGQASDLVPCTIVLNAKGINRLIPTLAEGKMLAFNFSYKILGAIEGASKEFRDFEAEYSIAVNLGGEALIGMEELENIK